METEDTSPKNSSSPETDGMNTTRAPGNEMLSFVWEVIKFFVLALIIVLPIRIFIAQPYLVNGDSMVPTFHNGNYLIVDQLTYRFEDPERGDVAVFRLPENSTRFLIKRIIGLPGETLRIERGVITIFKDGREALTLDESFLETPYRDTLSATLKDDEYFVMGDNRGVSYDSRVWGALPKNFLVGRPIVRLFPVREAALLPGKINYEENAQKEI